MERRNKTLSRLFCAIILVSCNSELSNDRLQETKIKTLGIEIIRYVESELTSMHDFVAVTKGNSTEVIMETNRVDSVYVHRDTIVIRTSESPTLYQLKEQVFNFKIKVDSIH